MTTGAEIYFFKPPSIEALTALIGEAKASGVLRLIGAEYERMVGVCPLRARSIATAYNVAVRVLDRCRRVSHVATGAKSPPPPPNRREWD